MRTFVNCSTDRGSEIQTEYIGEFNHIADLERPISQLASVRIHWIVETNNRKMLGKEK